MEIALQRFDDKILEKLPDYTAMDRKEFLKKADNIIAAHRIASQPRAYFSNAATARMKAYLGPYSSSSTDSESNTEDSAPNRVCTVKSKVVKPEKRSHARRSPSPPRSKKTASRPCRPHSPRRRQEGRGRDHTTTCYYHDRFGRNAVRCSPPCSWAKNE